MDDIQKRVYQNKLNKGFSVDNVHQEFCLLYGEVGEAYEAYSKKLPNLREELADVAIYLYGIAEILGYNLNEEIRKKVEINEKRTYILENGVYVKKEVK